MGKRMGMIVAMAFLVGCVGAAAAPEVEAAAPREPGAGPVAVADQCVGSDIGGGWFCFGDEEGTRNPCYRGCDACLRRRRGYSERYPRSTFTQCSWTRAAACTNYTDAVSERRSALCYSSFSTCDEAAKYLRSEPRDSLDVTDCERVE